MPDISNVGPTDYASKEVPKNYACTTCGATGVRLYREYQTFLNHSSLECTACAKAHYKRTHEGRDYDMEGKTVTFDIGWMVAAIPSMEGRTYWGYVGAPADAIEWWLRLPEKT